MLKRDDRPLPTVIDDDEPVPIDTTHYGIAHLLRDAQRAMSRALALRISAYGVSIGQWYFLRALWEQDGLTQRELSHRVGMMEPTTVTALNGMEKKGLVERVRNPRDRRKMNIYLTAKGSSLRDKLMPCEDEVNRLAVETFSDDHVERLRQDLRHILQRLAENGD